MLFVAGDSNALTDVFRHDRSTTTTIRISLGSAGAQASGGASTDPAINGDGARVAFKSLTTSARVCCDRERRFAVSAARFLSVTAQVRLSLVGMLWFAGRLARSIPVRLVLSIATAKPRSVRGRIAAHH